MALGSDEEERQLSSKEELSEDGKKIGWSFLPQDDDLTEKESSEVEEEVPFIDVTNPSSLASDESLPVLTRNQIISTCCSVCGTIAFMSFVLRSYAFRSSEILGTDPDLIRNLLSFSPNFTAGHLLVALAAAGTVSAARLTLYQQWNEFKIATDRSNEQVLTPLNTFDLFLVACLPGISEELLFRGSLISCFFPDYRGVLISGAAFGALHKGGGRNIAFVIWAALVGCFYGSIFLFTQDIYVPIIAHSSANLFSAFYWLSTKEQSS